MLLFAIGIHEGQDSGVLQERRLGGHCEVHRPLLHDQVGRIVKRHQCQYITLLTWAE